MRKTVRGVVRATGSGRVSIGEFVRWAVVPGIGMAMASWSLAIVAGLDSAASLAQAKSLVPHTLSLQTNVATRAPVSRGVQFASIEPSVVRQTKSARLSLSPPRAIEISEPTTRSAQDRFEGLAEQVRLSPEKVLAAFAQAGMTISAPPVQLALAMPLEERFYLPAAEPLPQPGTLVSHAVEAPSGLALPSKSGVELAYAAPPSPADAVWERFASLEQEAIDDGSDEPDAEFEAIPDSVAPPPRRPKTDGAVAPKAEAVAMLKPGKPAARPAKPEPEALAYARPDKPAGGVFKNLFNAPSRKAGVAVYDISAGVVHMPDGTRLEAHSGIGKMVDNPRYVHVKMKGPTPPNTYNLSMREKRFHGVEALRMTPVGGGKMHGRDGMLAHSYLLRGGRAESHGCVAFKNYPSFLKAFKQGKVKQLVVVPSLSKAQVRVAQNGAGA